MWNMRTLLEVSFDGDYELVLNPPTPSTESKSEWLNNLASAAGKKSADLGCFGSISPRFGTARFCEQNRVLSENISLPLHTEMLRCFTLKAHI